MDGELVLFADLPYKTLVLKAKEELGYQIREFYITHGHCEDCNKDHMFDTYDGILLDNLNGYWEVNLGILRSQAETITLNAHKMGHVRRHKMPGGTMHTDTDIMRLGSGIVEFKV